MELAEKAVQNFSIDSNIFAKSRLIGLIDSGF